MNQAKVTKNEFLKILEKHRGLVTYALKESQIARQTYYNWLKKDQDFKDKVDIINEGVIDWCESKLFDKVEEKDVQSIFFVLKAKAGRRGYWRENSIDNGNFTINIKIDGLDE